MKRRRMLVELAVAGALVAIAWVLIDVGAAKLQKIDLEEQKDTEWETKFDAAKAAMAAQDFQTAECGFHSLIDYTRREFGSNAPRLADCHFALGGVHFLTGRNNQARVEFERSLELQEQDANTQPQDLVPVLRRLSEVCNELGDFQIAEKYAMRDLEIRERFHGKDSLELKQPLINLTVALEGQKRTEAATLVRDRLEKNADRSHFVPFVPSW